MQGSLSGYETMGEEGKGTLREKKDQRRAYMSR